MIVAFELSMPSVASWNGKWSGEGRAYVKTRNISKKMAGECAIDEILKRRTFTYRWDDGWCAMVTVRKVESEEAVKLRRKSVGFCGYDWMIDSILDYGEILTRKEQSGKRTTQENEAKQ